MKINRLLCGLVGFVLLLGFHAVPAESCTGIRLIAEDGSTVYGRTMEWGAFDLNTRVAIVPAGYAFAGQTPDGLNGRKWQGKYGFVGLDMLGRDAFADGMNDQGLAMGLFYHPGWARYHEYVKDRADNTITAVDVLAFVLSQFTSIDEVRRGMESVRVVPVVEKVLGIPIDAHWMVTEPSGKSIVIEYLDGQLRIFDNPLGVITNAPGFDWHMTNLRNYVNLSPVAIPSKKINDLDFSPLGGGSGMIGLPGDYTPPSRFVRAVAWTQTARPLADSTEAIYELLRILDNFNLPLGAAEGSGFNDPRLKGMRSSTIWTSGWDLADKVLYFHTQHNRRLRRVQVGKIDFSGLEIIHLPLDGKKEQDVKDITPTK